MMADPRSDSSPLSAESVDILDALVRRSGTMRRPEPAPPGMADMIRYLTGDLSPCDQQAIERGLTTHAVGRTLLRQILPVMRDLQSRSWKEVARRAELSDFNGQVAQHWLALLAERTGELPGAVAHGRARDWTTLRREVQAGLQEARIAWGTFLAFGQQFRAELQRPRLALAKGTSPDSVALEVSALLPPVSVQLNAQITDDSDLVLEIGADLTAEQSQTLAERRLSVWLTFNGEAWPLGTVPLTETSSFLTIPRLGTSLDLPPGRLPASFFKVVLDAPALRSPEEPTSILAEACDASGQSSGAPVRIEVPSARWEEGHLVLEVALAEAERTPMAACALELALVLSPMQRQLLGVWPVREWTDTMHVLRVPCPGGPPSGLLPRAALRARLLAAPTT